MNNKKIIIFTGAFSSGGAEKQSILLAKALKDIGFQILIVSYFGEIELQRLITFMDAESIKYTSLKGSIWDKIKKFNSIVKTIQPDAIINYLPSNNIIGGILGRYHRTKMIIGNVRNSRLGILRYLELLFSNNFLDHITVFNNQTGLQYYSNKGFSEKKMVFIPNVLYPLPDLNINRKVQDVVQILMVSRFEKQKDYPTAIKVFSKLIERNSNLAIKLVGIGSMEEEVVQLIKANKIERHIEIIRNPENIFSYYKKADIFLQTSLFEGISNSILEAMSYSLPIVATNVGDNSELIRHNENGFLTSIRDVDAITDYLEQLIIDDNLREKMGKCSCEIVRTKFSMEKFTSNYVKLLNGER